MAFDRRCESSPWFDAGWPVQADEAHRRLGEDHGRPYCVYVHVPFCASICSFCALYTRAVRHDQDEVFDEYVAAVRDQLAHHPVVGRDRPPTTVHFGGGTPLHIGLDRLGRVTAHLRDAFGDNPTCEWAIETTTSSITAETMAGLAALGFGRVHLGIQTLDDTVRRRIGRRENGAEAVAKIRRLREAGFLLSVDLIIGFEDADEDVVAKDLALLFAAGIRMFSICERRPRAGAAPLGPPNSPAATRALWQTIWTFMRAHDLHPIHVGQFALRPEDNLYFTHPARGEDCVAVGPYAHGSASRLYYGNLLLPEYYDAVRAGAPAIMTGVLYDDDVQLIRDLESQLLSHDVRRPTVERMDAVFGEAFARLLAFWQRHELIVPASADGALALTCDGSWFVGNMILQARSLARPT